MKKAVVKLVCNSSYQNAVGIFPPYVYSLFTNCMTSCYCWHSTYSKQNVLDHLKYEVDNESSVVLGIKPDIIYKSGDSFKPSHAYVVISYCLEFKAIKLYNPNHCTKSFAFCKNLPLSLIKTADHNKGELWITIDQLKNRRVFIQSLCSKSMYKSTFQINKTIKLYNTEKHYSKVNYACKVDIKKESMFMTNLFSYIHKVKKFSFKVYIVNNEKQNVKLKDEIPKLKLYNKNQMKGEEKSQCYRRFKLQPNK